MHSPVVEMRVVMHDEDTVARAPDVELDRVAASTAARRNASTCSPARAREAPRWAKYRYHTDTPHL